MKLLLKRIYTNNTYTIGHLYIDDAYVCDTLEDADRGLDQSMSEKDISIIKVAHKTAIPTGEYEIAMNIISPKFSKKQYYMDVCKGKVPRILGVKVYSGILIHVGNTHNDTDGCVLVGWNKVKGKVINSKIAFENVYYKLKVAEAIGEKIKIKIVRTYSV